LYSFAGTGFRSETDPSIAQCRRHLHGRAGGRASLQRSDPAVDMHFNRSASSTGRLCPPVGGRCLFSHTIAPRWGAWTVGRDGYKHPPPTGAKTLPICPPAMGKNPPYLSARYGQKPSLSVRPLWAKTIPICPPPMGKNPLYLSETKTLCPQKESFSPRRTPSSQENLFESPRSLRALR
jgi:hypothetical protein